MGSPCELGLYAEDSEMARRVAKRIIDDALGIEARYSRYREDSILSMINRKAGRNGGIEVDEETAGLLDYAQTCYVQSDGLFDITSGILRKAWNFQSGKPPDAALIESLLPMIGWDRVVWMRPRLAFKTSGMELDFGGIGKEYAADRAATLYLEYGIRHGVVNFGGDIKIIGPHPDGSPWRIGIRHPRQSQHVMASIDLGQGAIASSGDYERCIEIDGRRYGHILNPRTGWPVQGFASVSVVASHCLIAGSACTIAMLKESAGTDWLEELWLPYIVADDKGRVIKRHC
ncbi:MAG: FAD:protein FMN transferase [Methylococcaceae bacterium]|nr:FAD:protein FMN transferase [Methylococcaceae bacterium]